MKKELVIPSTTILSEKATELVRIWADDSKQLYIINKDLHSDSAAYGLMLVDLAKHIARVYAENGQNEREVLERIKKGFDIEWNNSTE